MASKSQALGTKDQKLLEDYIHLVTEKSLFTMLKQSATVDLTTQAIRIAHTVGKKKRAEIIAKAKELNIKILNVKVVAQEAKAEGEEDS